MKDNRYTTTISWSVGVLYILAFFASISWQLFFLEYPYSSIFHTIALFIVFVVVSAVIQIILIITRTKITFYVRTLLAVCFLIATVIPPIYILWYGISITEHFTSVLGVNVTVESRMINPFDYIDDVGFPRNIHTVYKLQEGRSVAEEKIRQQLKLEDGWQFSGEKFVARCASGVTTSGDFFWRTDSNSVWFDENNLLHIMIFFHSPEQCRFS